MKKFKVGQKVRFIKSCSGYDFQGKEKLTKGIITKIRDNNNGMDINILNNDLFTKNYCNGKGFCFLSDVFDSVKVIPFWRFW